MIHLDTNLLIGAGKQNPTVTQRLRAWLLKREEFAASSIAWAEFLQGPVDPAQIVVVQRLIGGQILPFGSTEARLAAQLFNQTGRRRNSRLDCFIGAAAICANADFATENRRDFQPFVAAGLRLL
jgi:predicted nucleic acid-binding protein